jgi:hypothetical protein
MELLLSLHGTSYMFPASQQEYFLRHTQPNALECTDPGVRKKYGGKEVKKRTTKPRSIKYKTTHQRRFGEQLRSEHLRVIPA